MAVYTDSILSLLSLHDSTNECTPKANIYIHHRFIADTTPHTELADPTDRPLTVLGQIAICSKALSPNLHGFTRRHRSSLDPKHVKRLAFPRNQGAHAARK